MKKAVRVMLMLLRLACTGALLFPILFMFGKARIHDFYELLIEKFWFYPRFWNSFFLAAAIGLGASLLAFLAAAGLKWGIGRGRKVILSVLLLLMLMPLQVTLLPNYVGLRDMGLLDTRAALILPMVCSPFAIYLMYRYMETMPQEAIEAVRMETSSLFPILRHVIFPEMRSCLAAVFVFMFAEGFNMVEQPLYFVKRDELKPLSVLTEILPQVESYLIYAVGIVCMLPLLLLYGFYEEEIMEGLGYLKA